RQRAARDRAAGPHVGAAGRDRFGRSDAKAGGPEPTQGLDESQGGPDSARGGPDSAQNGPEHPVDPERRPVTMATNAYDSLVRTMTILAPELILILSAVAMMTLSAFVRLPRSRWCGAAVGVLLAALLALLWVSGKPTDMYASVAIN